MPAVTRKMLAVRCATSSPTVYSYLESSFGLFAVAEQAAAATPTHRTARKIFVEFMAPSVDTARPAPRSGSGDSGTRSSCDGCPRAETGRSAPAPRLPNGAMPPRDPSRETTDGGCLRRASRETAPRENRRPSAPGAPSRSRRRAGTRCEASWNRIRSCRYGGIRTRGPRSGSTRPASAPRSPRAPARSRGSREPHRVVSQEQQEDDAERDPVPAEYGEPVAGHDGGGPHFVSVEQGVAMLHEVEEGRGAQRRECQEERELGRGQGGASEDQPPEDRDHGAGHAGPERGALEEADPERGRERDRVHALVSGRAPARAAPALEEHHDDASGKKRDRDRAGTEEMLLDLMVKREPQDRRRQERDEKLEEEPPAPGARPHEPGQHLQDARAIEPDHGQERPGLDHDLERVHHPADEAHGVRGQDQVPGRGDRQELGEPFDRAEDRRLEDGHAPSPLGRRIVTGPHALGSWAP